uniref:Uncharacterized protein n=1 Tax=Anguilla anguilla TaxID=7936 RepID=A0A0E9SEC3_ANGAN
MNVSSALCNSIIKTLTDQKNKSNT